MFGQPKAVFLACLCVRACCSLATADDNVTGISKNRLELAEWSTLLAAHFLQNARHLNGNEPARRPHFCLQLFVYLTESGADLAPRCATIDEPARTSNATSTLKAYQQPNSLAEFALPSASSLGPILDLSVALA